MGTFLPEAAAPSHPIPLLNIIALVFQLTCLLWIVHYLFAGPGAKLIWLTNKDVQQFLVAHTNSRIKLIKIK